MIIEFFSFYDSVGLVKLAIRFCAYCFLPFEDDDDMAMAGVHRQRPSDPLLIRFISFRLFWPADC